MTFFSYLCSAIGSQHSVGLTPVARFDMKRLTIFFALLMSLSAFAQQPPFVGQWVRFEGNYVTTDINGNAINLRNDYLSQGKNVLVDLSATWCRPCWNMHQQGVLSMVNQRDDWAVIWIEGSRDGGVEEIYGRGDPEQTLGNWTVSPNGNPVPYRIVNEDAAPAPFNTIWGSVFPTLIVITPDSFAVVINHLIDGQWQAAQLVDQIVDVARHTPKPNQVPSCRIKGTANSMVGVVNRYKAEFSSLTDITSISWSAPGATPASGTQVAFACQWDTPGLHQVILAVTNAIGTAYDTLNVLIPEEIDGLLSYTHNYPLSNSAGFGQAGQVFTWAVRFPANKVNRHQVDRVDCFIANEQAGHYTMSVYQGGTTAPATLIGSTERDITANQEGAYATFTPEHPIAINPAQDLWIVMAAATPRPAAAALYDQADAVNFLSPDQGASWEDGGPDLAWLIDCYTSDNNGISRLSNAQASLYPNPTTGRLAIYADALQQVELLDLNGRLLNKFGATSSLDLSPYAPGLYLLRLTTATGVTTQKVIKQ